MARLRADQSGFLFHYLAVLFALALGRLGHAPYLQILNAYERVVLADRRCGFVQEVFSDIGNAGVNLVNFGFRLFPVVAELDLVAHAALVARKALLVFVEALLSGATKSASLNVAKRAKPTSMPMAVVAVGSGCSTSRCVWIDANDLPPD